MRVLITGAAGFIGSHVARVLVREGCETFALLRPGSNPWRIRELLPSIQVVECDLLGDEAALAAAIEPIRPEMALHFAWYAPGKLVMDPLNLRHLQAGLSLAMQLARLDCRRLVAAGTVSEYDLSLGYLSESSATCPTNVYGASKLALQIALEQFAKTTKMEIAWPRIFFLYGPAEEEHRLLPAIIASLLQNQPTRMTAGEQVRDYLHVADAAEAVWAVAQSRLAGVVNVASGVPVTLREMALRTGEILGKPDLIRLGDLPYREGESMFVCANTQLLKTSTGWTPCYSLDRGLRDTVAWWQKRFGETAPL